MKVGIDSFASHLLHAVSSVRGDTLSGAEAMAKLLERIEYADQVGLDVFGIGEHHRIEYLDSATAVILAAAAARTKKIILTSAVTVLSAVDPVRLFQQFATLDLISHGRAEMIVGRGSSTEAFPLFGFSMDDYDALFEEKLELLLAVRDNEKVRWSGKYRPALTGQGIYPRPMQEKLPIWIGVGGTPESFARAGLLGLPLMVAIIGGETHRFRPLDRSVQGGGRARRAPARDAARSACTRSATSRPRARKRARSSSPATPRPSASGRSERGGVGAEPRRLRRAGGTERGALLVGDPEEVAAKILRHAEALGGITRVTFQMDVATLPHDKVLRATELIGTRVAPLLRATLRSAGARPA